MAGALLRLGLLAVGATATHPPPLPSYHDQLTTISTTSTGKSKTTHNNDNLSKRPRVGVSARLSGRGPGGTTTTTQQTPLRPRTATKEKTISATRTKTKNRSAYPSHSSWRKAYRIRYRRGNRTIRPYRRSFR